MSELKADQHADTRIADDQNAWERTLQRATRGDRAKFLEVLARVPDVPPEEWDRMDGPEE